MPTRDDSTNDELVKQQRKNELRNAPRADGSGGDAARVLSALGNARVQRLMQRKEDGSGSVDDAVAKTIQSKRGGGSPLDESARRNLEPSMGQDFSDVRVHTDSQADSLNRAVSAEAFTTGNDIFFRNGSYRPGSSEGEKLLAHELTHVVQQRNAPPTSDMTVSSPDDASEREASAVADSYGSQSAETAAVSRASMPEEEEMLQGSFLDRQGMEEEELVQGSFIEREGMPEEEEMLQGSFLDRQEIPEDEEARQDQA
jgi:hypothetical protein